MKKGLILGALSLVLCMGMWLPVAAQSQNVNEPCADEKACKSGICLELRSGNKVCGTCSQSTFNSLAPKVDEHCKAFQDGWRAEKAPEYIASEVDGRVQVEVYDEMLEKAKACKQARVTLQSECFKGGEAYDKYDHAGQIKSIETSIDDLAAHKQKMIYDKRVYYCSKSTYEGALRQFDSKCSLDLNQVKQKLDAMKYDFNKGEKIDCDALEDLEEDCDDCAAAARDLINYGFKNSSSYTPREYSDRLEAMENMKTLLEDLREDADDKDLCD